MKVKQYILSILCLMACLTGHIAHANTTPSTSFEPLTTVSAFGEGWVALVKDQTLLLHTQKHPKEGAITKTYPTEFYIDNNIQVYHSKIGRLKLMSATLTLQKASCQSPDGQIFPYKARIEISIFFKGEGCASPDYLPTLINTSK